MHCSLNTHTIAITSQAYVVKPPTPVSYTIKGHSFLTPSVFTVFTVENKYDPTDFTKQITNKLRRYLKGIIH